MVKFHNPGGVCSWVFIIVPEFSREVLHFRKNDLKYTCDRPKRRLRSYRFRLVLGAVFIICSGKLKTVPKREEAARKRPTAALHNANATK
jgi:hypothetical protein